MSSHKLQRFALRYLPGALLLGILLVARLPLFTAFIICVAAALLGGLIYSFLDEWLSDRRALRRNPQ